MLQVVMWVRVQCDQCGDVLDAPEGEPDYSSERAACVAARAGWRGDPGGRWWCSACALVLACQERGRGHEFTGWRISARTGGAYRYCRVCCEQERRGPGQSPLTPPGHFDLDSHLDRNLDGVLVVGEVA
jgi:hypothetical protein